VLSAHPKGLFDAMKKYPESWNHERKVRYLIPWGSQARTLKAYEGISMPGFLKKGRGCRVTDLDGNEFIDFKAANGALLLGYSHPSVIDEVHRTIKDGILFSLPSELELSVAEKLVRLCDVERMVRFLKTGASANMAAIRVARAYTGRTRVMLTGYHGWYDSFFSHYSHEKEYGIPYSENYLRVPYGDQNALKQAFNKEGKAIAAVLLTPWEGGDNSSFAHLAANLCREHGALTIFDEVTTFLRFFPGPLCDQLGLSADFIVVGKTMASGFPLAALLGRKELMFLLEAGTLWFGETCGGERASLAAASATLDILIGGHYYSHSAEMGKRFSQGLKRMILSNDYPVFIDSFYPQVIELYVKREDGQMDMKSQKKLWMELIENRVLPSRFLHIMNSMEKEDIDEALDIFEKSFDKVFL
jgi:glutamate-1-semialdehyde 2,1-aminomutase